MNFLIVFLSFFVYALLYCYLYQFGSWYSNGLGHIICVLLLLLKSLKPPTSMLFAAVILGTLVISADDYPARILSEASIIALPLVIVALFPTAVWVLITFQTPTVNAPERLASTIFRAVTTHLAPQPGVVAGNVAEPARSDVFVVFFTNFLFLLLYYLQLKVGCYLYSGLAHLLCLILLFLEKIAPRKRIMVATVLLATIVLTSDDHPFEIVNKFVSLVTTVSILAAVVVVAIIAAIVICSEQLNSRIVRPVMHYLFAERDVGDGAAATRVNVRNEMIASSPAPPTTVIRQLDAVEGVVSPMCAEEALVDEPDSAQPPVAELGYTTRQIVVESVNNTKGKKRFRCVGCCC